MESIFSGRYGGEPGNITLKDIVKRIYPTWAKSKKRSWKNAKSRSKPILGYFKNEDARDQQVQCGAVPTVQGGRQPMGSAKYAKESGYLFENSQTGGPIKDVKTGWRNTPRDAGITDLPAPNQVALNKKRLIINVSTK